MSDGTVWATGQKPSRIQRKDRYLPASAAHPAKMLPAIAAQAIERFTEPGDWVADPMCGIGTTLIEAIHAGRHAIGVEYEPRWAALAAEGTARAYRHGAAGKAAVINGDARNLTALVPRRLRGKVALVLTSRPTATPPTATPTPPASESARRTSGTAATWPTSPASHSATCSPRSPRSLPPAAPCCGPAGSSRSPSARSAATAS